MQRCTTPASGEVLKKLCLKPSGLTVTQTARALGVNRTTLSSILNGRARVSPEMVVRLSIAFDTTAESWLAQQIRYDLWRARGSIHHEERHGGSSDPAFVGLQKRIVLAPGRFVCADASPASFSE